MKTGTADYFERVVESLACSSRIPRDAVSIIIDETYIDTRLLNNDYFGFPVYSYRMISDVMRQNDTRIYFLANNEFHGYCYESLSRAEKTNESKIISVIHEPSCFMLFNNICCNRRHFFSKSNLVEFVRKQFAEHSESIIQARHNDDLPFEVEFMIHGQDLALRKSDEIWTHSEFSKFKLRLESNETCNVKFIVSQHPKTRMKSRRSSSLPFGLRKAPGVKRAGVFGWVSKPKRIDSVIRAFAAALQTISHQERDFVELFVVGALPNNREHDPLGLSSSLGVSDRVKFFDYVPLTHFDELIDSCDLVFNLRFPSCGESSGTLERAVSAGVPIITSEYQAFAEAPTSAFVSTLWPREQTQLFKLLRDWLHGATIGPPLSLPSCYPEISDLIASQMEI
jgi:glycosyltransferase involved in cell wall biosynthesis